MFSEVFGLFLYFLSVTLKSLIKLISEEPMEQLSLHNCESQKNKA